MTSGKVRYLEGRSGGRTRQGNDGRLLYAKGLGTARVTRKVPRRGPINLGRIREDSFRFEDQPKTRVKAPGARKGQEGQTAFLTIQKAKKGKGGVRGMNFKSHLVMGKRKKKAKWSDNPNAFGQVWY